MVLWSCGLVVSCSCGLWSCAEGNMWGVSACVHVRVCEDCARALRTGFAFAEQGLKRDRPKTVAHVLLKSPTLYRVPTTPAQPRTSAPTNAQTDSCARARGHTPTPSKHSHPAPRSDSLTHTHRRRRARGTSSGPLRVQTLVTSAPIQRCAVCVCVCVRARARVRVFVCVFVFVFVCVQVLA